MELIPNSYDDSDFHCVEIQKCMIKSSDYFVLLLHSLDDFASRNTTEERRYASLSGRYDVWWNSLIYRRVSCSHWLRTRMIRRNYVKTKVQLSTYGDPTRKKRLLVSQTIPSHPILTYFDYLSTSRRPVDGRRISDTTVDMWMQKIPLAARTSTFPTSCDRQDPAALLSNELADHSRYGSTPNDHVMIWSPGRFLI